MNVAISRLSTNTNRTNIGVDPLSSYGVLTSGSAHDTLKRGKKKRKKRVQGMNVGEREVESPSNQNKTGIPPSVSVQLCYFEKLLRIAAISWFVFVEILVLVILRG